VRAGSSAVVWRPATFGEVGEACAKNLRKRSEPFGKALRPNAEPLSGIGSGRNREGGGVSMGIKNPVIGQSAKSQLGLSIFGRPRRL
jgi:hypothetical protein